MFFYAFGTRVAILKASFFLYFAHEKHKASPDGPMKPFSRGVLKIYLFNKLK